MECLLGFAPISVAFRCSSRFKVDRNRLQTGWADIFVPAMARSMIWQAEYSMVSPHPTTCLSHHTTSSTKRQFGLAKIRLAAISIFRRSDKFDDRMRFPVTVFGTKRPPSRAQSTTYGLGGLSCCLARAVPMLRGSFTSTFATQGVKRLITDRADQLRHSCLPPFEFAETVTNIAAATKHIPTTAYRTFMTTLQLGRADYQAT